MQATAEGWKSYLANPRPATRSSSSDNPQMEDALLAFGLAKMRSTRIVTGGDAARQGILTMTDARWKRTFEFMVEAGW